MQTENLRKENCSAAAPEANAPKDLYGVLAGTPAGQPGSVYEAGPMLHFPLPENIVLSASPAREERDDFARRRAYRALVARAQTTDEYADLVRELSLEDLPLERKAELRKQKKYLAQEISADAAEHIFGQRRADFVPQVLQFRGAMTAFSLAEVKDTLRGQSVPEEVLARPWFTESLAELRRMLSLGGPIGMEGGSCLIGSNELLFRFILRSGEERWFDFNTMRECSADGGVHDTQTSSALWDFVRAAGTEILGAEVVCRKNAITRDEWEEYTFLFSLASAFGVSLVVTIPDLSYEASFLSLFEPLPEEIRAPFHAAFLRETDRLSDLNLRWIRHFRELYPVENMSVLHRRDEAMCCLLRERGAEAFARSDGRSITKRSGMDAAVRDYICMPAMPYYLWGIGALLEVNRLEEMPSMEKCRHLHKGSFTLCSLLYPQRVCGNGKTSAFYAEQKDKDYINL